MAKQSGAASTRESTIQDFNYRRCSFCDKKVHDQVEIVTRDGKILERNQGAKNVGCGDKNNCKYGV